MNTKRKQATLDAYRWLLTDHRERLADLIRESEEQADTPLPEEEDTPRCWRQLDLLSRRLRVEWFQDAPKHRRCVECQGIDCDRLAILLLSQTATLPKRTEPPAVLRVARFPE